MTEARQQRNTADLLVECLEEEEVHYIFGIPGEENLPVMNAIEKSKIEFVTVRHERFIIETEPFLDKADKKKAEFCK